MMQVSEEEWAKLLKQLDKLQAVVTEHHRESVHGTVTAHFCILRDTIRDMDNKRTSVE